MQTQNNNTQLVQFTFDYYSEDDVPGRFETQKRLMPNDSIRSAAIAVIRQAIQQGAEVWTSDINQDSLIAIYIANEKIKDANIGFDNSGFGIKYALDSRGALVFLFGYSPLSFDWTLSELAELVDNGYIRGNVGHVIIGLPEGLGGEEDLVDIVGFLSDTVGPAKLLYKGTKRIWYFIANYKIRKIAKEWKNRGLRYPHELREFVETKAEWKLTEIKLRLKLDDQFAIGLLTALGLEPIGDKWHITHSRNSISKRRNWLRNERKYEKMAELENESA